MKKEAARESRRRNLDCVICNVPPVIFLTAAKTSPGVVLCEGCALMRRSSGEDASTLQPAYRGQHLIFTVEFGRARGVSNDAKFVTVSNRIVRRLQHGTPICGLFNEN